MGLKLGPMGCPGVAKVLVWGNPLGCRAQNKFFRAKTESIYDFEKWLFLCHLLTQLAKNWYITIIFDCLPENVKSFVKFKISFLSTCVNLENHVFGYKKSCPPCISKISLLGGRSMFKKYPVQKFYLAFDKCRFGGKKTNFLPPKNTFDYFG